MSLPITNLRLDFCSYAAAQFAVENWHYSGVCPPAKTVKIGVWESGLFVGVVMFGRGANNNIAKPFGLRQTEVCELLRVALHESHQMPTSRIVAIALRMLRKQSPGIRLVVSYADTEQGHHGGIYQAGGWLYLGESQKGSEKIVMPDGSLVHKRSFNQKYGTSRGQKLWLPPPKHKYVMPFDSALREKLLPQCKPYPKRAGSVESDAPRYQRGEGGATPTPALQHEERGCDSPRQTSE